MSIESPPRPPSPSVPMGPHATALKEAFKTLPKDYNLPWLPRGQLCSAKDLESRRRKLSEACGYPCNFSEDCLLEFANFYPCFNFFLRPSKRHDHGMDNYIDFAIIFHIFRETGPSLDWKELAIDKPWDEEFNQAVEILEMDV